MSILPIIVGAAGHVDHGKTSLVRLLTGRETDTLKEEQLRGMSIDLSVVPFVTDDEQIVGLVDVPGHRDYIKNSVAGISAIDILLLVVAADDGVMPQTIEHVKAAHFFGAQRAVVAINKIDLVDEEVVYLVKNEINLLLKQFEFLEIQFVETSCSKFTGIEAVKSALSAAIKNSLDLIRPDPRAFRMSVRKGFPVRGLGTVITGIPISGELAVGTELELLPLNKEITIKAAQHYRGEVEAVRAKISTALNTRDIAASEIERGMTLCESGLYAVSTQAYLNVKIVSSGTEIKPGSKLLLYVGCGAVTVQLRPLDRSRIEINQEGVCFAKFALPLVICAGDRFVLRAPGSGEIVGGGIVIAAEDIRVGKVTDDLVEALLESKSAVESADILTPIFLLSRKIINSLAELARKTHVTATKLRPLLAEHEPKLKLICLDEEFYFAEQRFSELLLMLGATLKRYHQKNKLAWGMRPELLGELLSLPITVVKALIEFISKKNLSSELSIEMKYGRVSLSSFSPNISSRDIALRERLLKEIAGREAHSIAAGDAIKILGCTDKELRKLVTLLVEEGELIVVDGNYLLKELYESCIETVKELGKRGTVIDLTKFRELTGLGRNLAVAILDEFDAKGITVRLGNERKLRKNTEKN